MFTPRRNASNRSLLSTRPETSLQSNFLFSISNCNIDDICEPVLSDQILLKKAFKFSVAERRRYATNWREQREAETHDSLNLSSKVFAFLFKSNFIGHQSRIQFGKCTWKPGREKENRHKNATTDQLMHFQDL
jgi:hypothetical protein